MFGKATATDIKRLHVRGLNKLTRMRGLYILISDNPHN